LRQVGGFLWFPPPINWPPRYNWNIVESGIKHHKPKPNHLFTREASSISIFYFTYLLKHCLQNVWRVLTTLHNYTSQMPQPCYLHPLQTLGLGINLTWPVKNIKWENELKTEKSNHWSHTTNKGQLWSYGSWIYNYLNNQCLSSLMLWVRISVRVRCTTLCDNVCQWLATGRWFSPGSLVSSTNKTDHHDITEILLQVALNTIKQTTTYYK
jgi:hypothetical protein